MLQINKKFYENDIIDEYTDNFQLIEKEWVKYEEQLILFINSKFDLCLKKIFDVYNQGQFNKDQIKKNFDEKTKEQNNNNQKQVNNIQNDIEAGINIKIIEKLEYILFENIKRISEINQQNFIDIFIRSIILIKKEKKDFFNMSMKQIKNKQSFEFMNINLFIKNIDSNFEETLKSKDLIDFINIDLKGKTNDTFKSCFNILCYIELSIYYINKRNSDNKPCNIIIDTLKSLLQKYVNTLMINNIYIEALNKVFKPEENIENINVLNFIIIEFLTTIQEKIKYQILFLKGLITKFTEIKKNDQLQLLNSLKTIHVEIIYLYFFYIYNNYYKIDICENDFNQYQKKEENLKEISLIKIIDQKCQQ